jgi:predicted nucleic acid-binding Zn finger protein
MCIYPRVIASCTIVFPHYLIIGKFTKNGTESKMCVLIFSTPFSETFFIRIRNERDMIKNAYLSSCSVPFIVKLYNSISTLSHDRQVFRKNGTESKICVLTFSKILSERFFIIIRNERDMIKNVYLSSCSIPVIVNLYNSFSTLSHNWQVLQKNGVIVKCVFWVCLQLFSETFFIIIRNERDMIKNVYLSSCHCQVVQKFFHIIS